MRWPAWSITSKRCATVAPAAKKFSTSPAPVWKRCATGRCPRAVRNRWRLSRRGRPLRRATRWKPTCRRNPRLRWKHRRLSRRLPCRHHCRRWPKCGYRRRLRFRWYSPRRSTPSRCPLCPDPRRKLRRRRRCSIRLLPKMRRRGIPATRWRPSRWKASSLTLRATSRRSNRLPSIPSPLKGMQHLRHLPMSTHSTAACWNWTWKTHRQPCRCPPRRPTTLSWKLLTPSSSRCLKPRLPMPRWWKHRWIGSWMPHRWPVANWSRWN
ncbi:hypothetical protein D3C81_999430 [compost metagenome]